MVNVTSAAQATIAAYGALVAQGRNYSIPLPGLATEVSSFFLPGYTAFSLGEINISSNQSVVAENFIKIYQLWREGPGTQVYLTDSRVEVVSNQSALCWLTYHICPEPASVPSWDWTNVYGFRLVEGGLENGYQGGWEFVNGDNEAQEYAKRYPNATVQKGRKTTTG